MPPRGNETPKGLDDALLKKEAAEAGITKLTHDELEALKRSDIDATRAPENKQEKREAKRAEREARRAARREKRQARFNRAERVSDDENRYAEDPELNADDFKRFEDEGKKERFDTIAVGDGSGLTESSQGKVVQAEYQPAMNQEDYDEALSRHVYGKKRGASPKKLVRYTIGEEEGGDTKDGMKMKRRGEFVDEQGNVIADTDEDFEDKDYSPIKGFDKRIAEERNRRAEQGLKDVEPGDADFDPNYVSPEIAALTRDDFEAPAVQTPEESEEVVFAEAETAPDVEEKQPETADEAPEEKEVAAASTELPENDADYADYLLREDVSDANKKEALAVLIAGHGAEGAQKILKEGGFYSAMQKQELESGEVPKALAMTQETIGEAWDKEDQAKKEARRKDQVAINFGADNPLDDLE